MSQIRRNSANMKIQYLFHIVFVSLFLSFVSKIEGVCSIKTPFLAEVSFMVVDYKYSSSRGVKVCEVQHSTLSKYRGDYALYGYPGNISKNFCGFLQRHQNNNIWYVNNACHDPALKAEIKNYPWNSFDNVSDLLEDDEFIERYLQPVKDPTSINDYHGFVYLKPSGIRMLKRLQVENPGILVLDVATIPFWKDKYKMSLLFQKDSQLSKYKPYWNLYEKKYSRKLAKNIINDLGGDMFVIKPRGGFHGNGVLIADRSTLDKVLYQIIKKASKLSNHPDPSYSYWYSDKHDTFIVEAYSPTDPKPIPQFDNKLYDPTIRTGFVAYYHNGDIQIDFLGSYWKIPLVSLEDEGTLTDKHKSDGGFPNVMKLSDEEWEEIEVHLRECLTLLYKQFLEYKEK